MFGNISLLSSITFHWLQSLKVIFSVFMEVFLQVSTLLIKSSNSIESWKYHTRDQFAIFCGLILMIDAVGVSHQEVPDTHLVKISLSNSIIQMTLSLLPVHINLLWMDTIGHTTEISSQYSPLPTTAIDAVMKPPSWRSTSSWSILSFNLTQLQSKTNLEISTEEPQITSCEEGICWKQDFQPHWVNWVLTCSIDSI